MKPHIITIANAFYVGAAVFGVPSFVATILYAVFRVRLLFTPVATGDSFSSVKNPDAILLILGGMVRALGAVTGFISGAGQFVFGVIAAVAGVVLAISIVLFLTGRGLHAHQGWARGVGGVMMLGMFLTAAMAVLSMRGPLLLIGLLVMGASAYALWGLWRGFAA